MMFCVGCIMHYGDINKPIKIKKANLSKEKLSPIKLNKLEKYGIEDNIETSLISCDDP